MSDYRVVVAARAEAQIRAIDAWWRLNYTIDEQERVVTVRAVWHGSRGEGPQLR